jgi:hypothetical protein
MIERLRTLPPLGRFSVYVAGALLVFFVAIGMGAAAAVVVGWQSGAATTGVIEGGASDGGQPEKTVATRTREAAVSKPSTRSNVPATEDRGVSFVHRSKDENSRGDYTIISDPSINGHPNAIVLVSLTSDRAESYKHEIGVWYVRSAHKWAIFNQDFARVPAGTTFEVNVPEASAKFVHEADLLNTAGNYTYLDDPLTNGKPDATLSVTQNWNPGGGRGVYNDHPVGVEYDPEVEKWAVYNRDGKTIPEGAAFNVAVSASSEQPPK